jgi:hypothetical protein
MCPIRRPSKFRFSEQITPDEFDKGSKTGPKIVISKRIDSEQPESSTNEIFQIRRPSKFRFFEEATPDESGTRNVALTLV